MRWRSKRSRSNAVRCVTFTSVIEGQNARDQIALKSTPIILSRRLGLRAPLVVRNKIY